MSSSSKRHAEGSPAKKAPSPKHQKAPAKASPKNGSPKASPKKSPKPVAKSPKKDEGLKFYGVITYVPDVKASLDFFERAFGLKTKFLHESGMYGEVNTGDSTISFFSPPSEGDHQLYPGGYVEAKSSAKPLGVEIALTAPDVVKAHKRALDAGAKELSAPADKPWGQKVSYVRCPDGTVVELCSPMQCTSC